MQFPELDNEIWFSYRLQCFTGSSRFYARTRQGLCENAATEGCSGDEKPALRDSVD